MFHSTRGWLLIGLLLKHDLPCRTAAISLFSSLDLPISNSLFIVFALCDLKYEWYRACTTESNCCRDPTTTSK